MQDTSLPALTTSFTFRVIPTFPTEAFGNVVSFWVSKAHIKNILGCKCVSDKIITIRFNTTPTLAPATPLNMCIYMHLLPTPMTTLQIRVMPSARWTSSLEIFMLKLVKNSRKSRGRGHLGTHIGKFGLGEGNEKGQRLLQFCIDHNDYNLSITNTLGLTRKTIS